MCVCRACGILFLQPNFAFRAGPFDGLCNLTKKNGQFGLAAVVKKGLCTRNIKFRSVHFIQVLI